LKKIGNKFKILNINIYTKRGVKINMGKYKIQELIKLAEKMNKEDLEQFMFLKGYLLGTLNTTKKGA
jgi:hypothetical protein